MDDWTRAHLQQWLDNRVCDVERDDVERVIVAAVDTDPNLIEGPYAKSWDEIRDMCDNANAVSTRYTHRKMNFSTTKRA